MKMGLEFLISSSNENQQTSLILWDYESLNVQRVYRSGNNIGAKTLNFIGNDIIIAAESNKPLLHCWPMNSQEPVKNVRLVLPEPVTCMHVCPKNTFLAAGFKNKLYVWHLPSGKLISVQQKNYQPITCVQFSNDADFLIVTGQDGMLITYRTGDLVAGHNLYLSQSEIGQVEPLYIKNDHSMPIRDLSVGNFGRKSRVVTVSDDQTARLYNLFTGDLILILTLEEPVTATILDQTCWKLFLGTNSGLIKQFNLRNPPRFLTQHISKSNTNLDFIGHVKKISSLAINFTNTILASASDDCYIFTWDLRSRQILKKIEHKGAVRNVKFVLNHRNFFDENYKSVNILKSFERSLNLTDDSFSVALIQTDDIELSDEEDWSEKNKVGRNLEDENRMLRIINHRLYEAALEIGKEFHNK